jgi:formate-nitrite transporter family protein
MSNSETLLSAPIDSADHVDGPLDAELELIMYGDFQCPYCAAAYPIVGRVRQQLAGRLRYAFRHFPLTDVHPDAQRAAEAAEAAAAQGSFWPMYDRLYIARGHLGRDALLAYALELGLDRERVATEIDSGAHAERVERDVASGRESGVTGTPAFFANGRLHGGAFDARSLLNALAA